MDGLGRKIMKVPHEVLSPVHIQATAIAGRRKTRKVENNISWYQAQKNFEYYEEY